MKKKAKANKNQELGKKIKELEAANQLYAHKLDLILKIIQTPIFTKPKKTPEKDKINI